MALCPLLLSALLLAWSPTTLCSGPVSLNDIVCNMTAYARHEGDQGVQERQPTPLQLPGAAADCPVGWSRHQADCYLIPRVAATWLGAAAACSAIDSRARLASVRLANHQHVEALVTASDAHYVWAGGVRLRPGGADWAWLDGAGLDYTNWAPGQATDAKEDCIVLQGPLSEYNAKTGEWHDASCSLAAHNFHFICQIKLV